MPLVREVDDRLRVVEKVVSRQNLDVTRLKLKGYRSIYFHQKSP